MMAPVIDRVFNLDANLRSSWACRGPRRRQTSRISRDRRSVATPPHPTSTVLTILMGSFTVEPQLRPAGNGEQIVVTRIIPRSGDSHETDYVMRNTPSGRRAVDVLADGAVSRVAVQR
jgi:phospholipid transport system substrate-binding protein